MNTPLEQIEEIQILNDIREKWGSLHHKDSNGNPTFECTVEVANYIKCLIEATYNARTQEVLYKVGNFVGELYQTGNMGDNEHALLVEFFDKELSTLSPEVSNPTEIRHKLDSSPEVKDDSK